MKSPPKRLVLLFPYGVCWIFLDSFIPLIAPPFQTSKPTKTQACAAKPGREVSTNSTDPTKRDLSENHRLKSAKRDGICDQKEGMSILYYTFIPLGPAFFFSGLPWLSGLLGSQNVSVDEQTLQIAPVSI